MQINGLRDVLAGRLSESILDPIKKVFSFLITHK